MAGALREARRQLLTCAQDACPAAVRADCVGWLDDVERMTPTVLLVITNARGEDALDAQVRWDGAPLENALAGRAFAVDPGPHVLRVEAPGAPPVERALSIREGERGRRVAVRLSEPPAPSASTPRRLRTSARVLAGVGAVSLGVGTGLALAGHRLYDQLRDQCASDQSCSPYDTRRGRREYVAADVAFALGGGAALVAVASFWLDRRQSATRSTAFAVWPSQSGATCSVSARF